jgi:hypothetical protein
MWEGGSKEGYEMKSMSRGIRFRDILLGFGLLIGIAVLALVAVRVIGGKPLGIRSWVDIQIWHTKTLAQSIAHSREVKSFSQGEYTNVVFLHHSVGENLLTQTDLRDRLSKSGLSVWDHDYNWYGLNDPNGTSTGYNYWIPDDNTDPDGLAKLFSQEVYGMPLNGISGLMQHEVIVFKSCFTGNNLGDDQEVDEVKGYYETIHQFISEHPENLFILLTTPPLNSAEADPAMAARDRLVSDWLLSADFQRGLSNLYVFDFFSLLTDNDLTSQDYNTLRADYRTGSDNHPNLKANQAVAPVLAEFIIKSINEYAQTQK